MNDSYDNAPEPPGAPSRAPLYLSAMLLPGAGQFLQHRWVPAIVFSLGSLACFLFLVLRIAVHVAQNFQAASAFMNSEPNLPFTSLPIAQILWPLGMAVLLYVINLCDVYLVYLRDCHRWAQRRLEQKLCGLSAILLCALLGSGPAQGGELHDAINTNDLIQVDWLLANRDASIVTSTITGGITPLHLAASRNQRTTCSILLAAGAPLEARTDNGFTPLHWAAGKDAADAAAILLTAGADVNAEAVQNITPLHWAATRNATNTLVLLLRAGASTGKLTEKGFSPLHSAVRSGAEEAQMLIAYKTVTDELDSMPMPPPPTPAPPEEDAREELLEGPPAADPAPTNQPGFGKTLIVPLGLNESLSLAWISELKLWAGRTEISNGEFRRFRRQHNSLFREGFTLDGSDQPVVRVTWYDAQAFCDWLNKEFVDRIPSGFTFRLPTSREWIVMARAGTRRRYPWGNAWPPAYGNYSDLTARDKLPDWRGFRDYRDGFVVSCPVWQSGTNEWGLVGLAGNVWEWCNDWYDARRTYKVRHGGSWDFDPKETLAVDWRGFDRPETRDDTIGFRIVVAIK